MLKRLEYEKLLHDLKRVSKGLKLVSEEKNAEKRHLICSLLTDELDRLYEDIAEMKKYDTKKGEDNAEV